MPELQESLLGSPKVQQRFWSKVKKTEGCWEWVGATTGGGYGSMFFQGRSHRAHRIAWMMVHGPIPEGLHVMHSCDNVKCVRLDHLSLGTMSDNILDAVSKGRWANGNSRRVVCIHGHPLVEENVYLDRRGHRSCRTCKAASTTAWNRKVSAARIRAELGTK